MRIIITLLFYIVSIFSSFSQDIIGIWKFEKMEPFVKTNNENATADLLENIKESTSTLIYPVLQFTKNGEVIMPHEKSSYLIENECIMVGESLDECLKYSVDKDNLILTYEYSDAYSDVLSYLFEKYPDLVVEYIRFNIHMSRMSDDFIIRNYSKEKIAFAAQFAESLKNNNCEGQEPYVIAEEMPQFRGGEKAMYQFISDTMEYPEIALKRKISGRVTVRFVVQCNGEISDITVIRGVDESLDKEAIRIVKAMPAWFSGKQNGKIVPVYWTLPIAFRLDNK